MKIEFVGAARTVTGSCYILKNDDFTIMIDCGMFQGTRELKERNFLDLIYAPKEIDALLLTHAHIDHSGLIPKLVKEGFTGSIYASQATVDLCSIMLPDSAHVQEMDNEWVNRKNRKMGRDPVELLYTVEEAEACMRHFVPVKYGDTVEVLPGVRARFRDAGHILGSSFIEIWVEEKGRTRKIVFSGDVGSKGQAIIRDPESVEEADILLVESTYGDRLHKSRTDTYEEFKKIIIDSYNNKGNIVIPSFAVERTQEIVFILRNLLKDKAIPAIPVYIDSPLAISATEIFRKHADCFDEETKKLFLSGEDPLDFPGLHYTRSSDESKRLNDEAKGAIIISASGMCNAGRIKYHLMNNLYRPESCVVFVGYQAQGTLGRKLVDGEKRVKIYGEDVAVKAKIHTLGGFSAHADRDGLLGWMSGIKGTPKVFVVHGEEGAALNFAGAVKEKFGHDTAVPRWGEIIDLDTMQGSVSRYGKEAPTSIEGREAPTSIEGEIEELKKEMDGLLARYEKARREKKIFAAERLGHDLEDLRQMVRTVTDEM